MGNFSRHRPLANNNKRNQPRKNKNNNKQNKSRKSQNKPNNQLTVMVRTAPVSTAPRMRFGNVSKSTTMANGHTRFKSQTCFPVTADTNVSQTLTGDLTVGNTTLFPNAGNLAKNFDKVKFRSFRARWVSALPTTAGGSVALFFDTDRTDVGPTSMQEAAQNKNCVMGPLWDKLSYNVPKAMLRPGEWFTTNRGASSAGTENTFPSPGRVHVFHTAQPGLEYTTTQTLGYVVVDYDLEFGFPTSPVDTTVPTRRSVDQARDTSFVVYDERLVNQWKNFAAGCSSPPDFYQFLSCFDELGQLRKSLAFRFDPDQESMRLRPSASTRYQHRLMTVAEVGDPNPFVATGVLDSFLPHSDWSSEDETDSND